MGLSKAPKKREASSQNGPPSKKRKDRSADSTAAGKATDKKPKVGSASKSKSSKSKSESTDRKVQRKVPITRARIVEVDSGSESDLDGEGANLESDSIEGEEGDFEGVEGEEAEFEDGDESMQVDEGSPQKELKSAKESHKAQKVLQQERRAAKQHSDILSAAKPLWALARRKEVPKAERAQDIARLHDAVRGRVQDVVLKHDASRIIQTLVKHGSPSTRDEIAKELSGRFRELAQNKYSKFLVTKLIRLCPKHRASILAEFKGHVVRLLLHREATGVLADAFELYANAFERSLLAFDFYGREVALFTPSLSKGAQASDEEKAQLKKGLAGVLEDADEDKRKRVLTAIKENLELLINNPDKGAISHAIFHHVLWEYLSQLNELEDETLRSRLRQELVEACQEQLADMVHTKDGSRLVREFIAQGSAKDRKQIVKVLKPYVERICKDDDAQTVLFTALDVIDDTKLTAKYLVAEMTAHARTLYTSAQGRRALLYLLVPRSSRHFTPALSSLLAETDSIREKTSKKEPEMRRREILVAASAALIQLCENEGVEELLRDPGGSLLVTEIMLVAEGDKTKAMQSLITLLKRPYPSSPPDPQHIIDIPHASRTYKTLLQGGHYSHAEGAVTRPSPSPPSDSTPSFDPSAFASRWLNTIDSNTTKAIGLGGGTFVLAALVDIIRKEGSEEDRKALAGQLDRAYAKEVEKSEVKGKKVLLDALNSVEYVSK